MALVQLPQGCTAAAQRAADLASDSGSAAAAAAGSGTCGGSGSATSADAKWVQDMLHYQHRIECPVKCVGGRLFVRVSGEAGTEGLAVISAD